jgi:hypothetical protein
VSAHDPLALRGPYQGAGVIGDVTEALHAWLQDGWPPDRTPPRVVEDLAFEPKDREEVVYACMYRVARNTALLNPKRWRRANVADERDDRMLYSRPPVYLDLFYLVAAHARFRSDAERLLGWVLLRLNEATHLIHRPRRYVLPDGRVVDATGRPWSADARGDDVIMEKVSVDLVDDLSVGEAVHLFGLHEAPYRPYVTYRARCALEGALVDAPPTLVRVHPPTQRVPAPSPRPGRSSRARLGRRPTPFGPPGTAPAPIPTGPTSDED